MKAFVLESVGNIICEDVEVPKIPDGWVLVKVKVAGICSSDIPRIFENGTYHFPTIPGHEFSGIVYDTSPVGDRNIIGKRCAVFPLIPCGKCDQCSIREYQRCKDYDYIGSRRDGAFAEYVLVPEWNIVQIPDEIGFEEASMIEPISVAMHAIKKVDVKGKKVTVIGTGIIGFSLALIARKMGADVAMVARNNDKQQLAEKLGIEYVVGDEKGSDIVFECVGSNDSLIRSINNVKTGGMIVLVGNPYGDMFVDKKTYWSLLRREITVKGIWNSNYDKEKNSDWTDVITLMKEGVPFKDLITHTFDKDAFLDALKLMKSHEEPYCKVVVKW